MDITSALRVAISLYLLPAQSPKIQASPLPEGVDMLLQIAIGNEKEISHAMRATNRSRETVKKASVHFIENILLSSSSDSYRILGANPNASRDELRRNMALMTRYLHPDITSNPQHAALITQVTDAWNNLKSEKERAAYDKKWIKSTVASPKIHTKPQTTWQRANSSRPQEKVSPFRPSQHLSKRRQIRGALLRRLTLMIMKISGR